MAQKNHEVGIVLECKNDTNIPVFLELWVLEVGMGLGKRGKDPGKSQKHSMITK